MGSEVTGTSIASSLKKLEGGNSCRIYGLCEDDTVKY